MCRGHTLDNMIGSPSYIYRDTLYLVASRSDELRSELLQIPFCLYLKCKIYYKDFLLFKKDSNIKSTSKELDNK